MSHFTVLVTKTNDKDVDTQLAPFDESREMARYVEHTKAELIAKGRKKIEEYRDGLYARYLADPEAYKADCRNEAHLKYLQEEFPKKLEWTDEEIYQDQAKWYEPEQIGPEGEVYSTSNPDAKWDWYQVGGRWAGFFQTKPGADGERGQNGLMGSHASESGVDVIKVNDIDWAAMEDEIRQARRKEWREEMAKPEDRRFVWGEEVRKCQSEEEYASLPVSLSTFAVLHDSTWYERGDMGW